MGTLRPTYTREQVVANIAELEAALVARSPESIANRASELSMKILWRRMEGVPDERFKRALETVLGTERGPIAFGKLLHIVREVEGGQYPEEDCFKTLWRVNSLRTPAIHDNTKAARPSLEDLLEVVRREVRPMLVRLGYITTERLGMLHDEAVARHNGMVDTIEDRLDRTAQSEKIAIATSNAPSRRLVLFFVDGEEKQGHGVIRARLHDGLKRALGTLRSQLDDRVAPHITWPTEQPRYEVRLAQLFAATGDWFRYAPPPVELPALPALPPAWEAWLEGLREAIIRAVEIDPALLVHRMEFLQEDDDKVLSAYLHHLWRPVAEKLKEATRRTCRVALYFEVERVSATGARGPLQKRWRRNRDMANAIGRCIEAFDAPRCQSHRLPELSMVGQREIEAYLADEEYPLVPEERRELAEEAWLDSGGGRFEPLVERLRRRFKVPWGASSR